METYWDPDPLCSLAPEDENSAEARKFIDQLLVSVKLDVMVSKKVVSAVILTTPTFDATSVDPLSVRLGRNETREIHGRGHIQDVNRDGYRDLVLHFGTENVGF